MRAALPLALMLLAVPARAEVRTLSHYRARPGAVMANGKPYSDARCLVASRAYPLGTRLRITLNGRTVVATVEDRTARRHGGRVDVNEAVRRRLRFRGIARGRVTVLREGGRHRTR